jgi:hypothetical protein
MMDAKIRKVNGVNMLEVQVPINYGPSRSGGTHLVASSHGNRPTAVLYEGQSVTISVNAYVSKPCTEQEMIETFGAVPDNFKGIAGTATAAPPRKLRQGGRN